MEMSNQLHALVAPSLNKEVSACSTNRVSGHVLNDSGLITDNTQVYEVW
jgi:hypothetical protein